MFLYFLALLITPVVAPFSPTPSPTAPSPSTSASPTSISTLLAFKASIDPSGYFLSSWNASSSFYCDWPGITCDQHLRDVVEINLRGQGLYGTLSSQIENLQKLTVLDLSRNSVYGKLPSTLGRMKSLQTLDLSVNQFFGSLPSSIGRLESLQNLDLSGNQLSGKLPSTLWQMESLRSLTLTVNRFSGELPSTLGWNMKSLLTLDLSYNSFSGPLPSSLGQMESLQTLDLSYNRFSGPLPSSLGQIDSLQMLYLSGNRLSGKLPSTLGWMKSLQTLDLSRNQLSGELPSSLGRMKSLGNLLLSHNQFSGPLPSSLGQMESLQILDLSENRLSDMLPSTLRGMKSLQNLTLTGNQFSGELPSTLGQMKSLQTLDLSANRFSGPLPSSLGWMESLEVLNLSGNWLSGALPSFSGESSYLFKVDLSRNQLSGPFPTFLEQMVTLYVLDLSYNQLSGRLPSSIDFLSSLEDLNVSYNRLQGSIPFQFYQKFSLTSFLGNPELRAPDQGQDQDQDQDHSYLRNRVVVVVCAVGFASFLVSLAGACTWYHFKRKKHLGSVDFRAPQHKAWTVDEMRVATKNFHAHNIIGSGATSVCYLGAITELPEGTTRLVAFKKLIAHYDCDRDGDDDDDDEEEEEAKKSFVNECKTLCQLRHRNLVKMVGYCVEGRENFALVMEYMDRGDLDRRLHLHKSCSMACKMSWEERVNVALNVAEGLVYLHHEYEQPIIHCDIKPQNILLGADMVAKISDFGIARLVEAKERGDISMSKLRGSFGYIAPEYGMGLKISTKVDVYSYGMLLLELVTEVKPTSLMLGNIAMSLPTWCQTLQASDWIKDVFQDCDFATLQEAKKLLRLGVQCTHDVAKKRPTMYTVRDCILQLKKERVQNELTLPQDIEFHLNN